jgi:hypothetical protein
VVYPASAHVAAVPFGVMPCGVAMVLFTTMSLGSIVGALWIPGVRDYRCFGATFLSIPGVHALNLGGLTPLLLLGAAIMWRYPERRWAPAMRSPLSSP